MTLLTASDVLETAYADIEFDQHRWDRPPQTIFGQPTV